MTKSIPLKRLSHGAMWEALSIAIITQIQNLPDDTYVPLFRVGGFIARTKTVTTTYGDSVRFGGEFKATYVNKDGEVIGNFESTVMYLPSAAEAALTNAWNGRPAGTKDMAFLWDIGVRKYSTKQGETKYEFEGSPVMDMPVSDRMTALLQLGKDKAIGTKAELPKPAAAAPAQIEAPKPAPAAATKKK